MTVVTKGKGASRRQFLRGTGGALLALPFLGSLLEGSTAKSQFVPPKRFAALVTQHGGVWPSNMYPDPSTADRTVAFGGGWDAHYGDLVVQSDGTQSWVSELIKADSSILTPTLASKMMLIQGIDVPLWIGHNQGVTLGNFGESQGGEDVGLDKRPTIDQVLAWSDGFHGDLAGITMRSIHLGVSWNGNISWGWSNPADQSGEIVKSETIHSTVALFDQLFPGQRSGEGRPSIVDRVLESHRRLSSGRWGQAARLSTDDRRRLDDHMERLHELDRRLSVGTTCDPTPPVVDAEDAEGVEKWSLYNDVVATAFMCGVSRIATYNPAWHWYDGYSHGDWHQEVAHRANEEAPNPQQTMMVESHRRWITHILLDLAQKLDVEEADGRTYLDNSLLVYGSESGPQTHYSWETPVFTLGSAGGAFNTGRYYDFRDRFDDTYARRDWLTQQRRRGASCNQWLANVLMALGSPPSEWERPGERGYGGKPDGFDEPFMQIASDPLPAVTAL